MNVKVELFNSVKTYTAEEAYQDIFSRAFKNHRHFDQKIGIFF